MSGFPETRKYAEAVWQFRETRDSEYAVTTVGAFRVVVQDQDGDSSRFEVRRGHERGGPLVAVRESIGFEDDEQHLYHFEIARRLAWETAYAMAYAEEYAAWQASDEGKRIMAEAAGGR
jgi:hypothetical protein